MQETQVWSLAWEDPLEKEMATYSCILTWKNPMDREAWRATVHGITKELDTTEWLNKDTYVVAFLLTQMVTNLPAIQETWFHPWVRKIPWRREWLLTPVFFFFFPFIFISWRLITSQHFSGFCQTLTWISHVVTCIPHPDHPSHLPFHPIPLGLPSAPGRSTCLMHPTWAGDLFPYR